MVAIPQLLAEAAPAGGAATGETLIATGGALVISVAMLAIVIGHRSGRLPVVQRIADLAERVSGIPGWASLPLFFVLGALLVAVLGMYWDVSIHIDEGRDPGPLANAAHYLILLGLFGIFFAGLLSMALPRSGRPSDSAIRITRDWYAPLGGVLIVASSSFALGAFPLDDTWHRLFGQDVTLWGPTHLLLIGGAGMATVGSLILLGEGVRSRDRATPRNEPRWLLTRQAILAGAFLVALSTFQAEFDFGVPQFQLLYQPILLMLAAGMGIVSARLMIGRGGALLAVAVYLAIRGLLSFWVGPLTGHSTLHFPLYVAEAIVVELVALRADPQRPLRFGALAGVGIATVGLAAEWGWSHIWMPLAWPDALLPEGVIFGVIAGIAGGVLGGFIGGSLSKPAVPRPTEARWLVPAASVAAFALIAYPLPMNDGDPARAQVSLRDVSPPPKREVMATVKLDPSDAADDAQWLTVTAWQGGGSVVDPLERIGPGRYRTTKPIPVHGAWKSILRLHDGRRISGVPVFMPEDPAIPAAEVPARERFTRSFRRDKENLQREQKEDVSGVLVTGAYLTVLAIALGLLGALGWGLARFARSTRDDRPPLDREVTTERTAA